MNICFIMGKIIEEVNFNFILNGKNDSIAKFRVKLSNGAIICIAAYNKNADYCYRKLEVNDMVCVMGKLDYEMNIVAEQIYKL